MSTADALAKLNRFAYKSRKDVDKSNMNDLALIKETIANELGKKRSIDEVAAPDCVGSDPKKAAAAAKLSEEQQRILDRVVREGESVLITGNAGTGKSFLLRHIIEALPQNSLYVTGSTGIAAVNVGGITLHSFAGVGLAQEPLPNLIQKLVWKTDKQQAWKECKTLIIDEISMVSAEFFEKLDGIARAIRGKPALPFGGIQLVCTGDFLQLAPIVNLGAKDENGKPLQTFCFETESWKQCIRPQNQFLLKKVWRQRDTSFVRMLSEIRRGLNTPELLAPLLPCVGRTLKCDIEGMEATKICVHKRQVNEENATHLDRLKGPQFEFKAKDTGETKLLNNVQAPPLLNLKVGAQVMLLKNLDVANGLCNGTCGIVTEFTDQVEIEVSEKDNLLQKWVKKKKKSAGLFPVVKFENGTTCPVVRSSFEINVKGERVACRSQLPLMLAWAITVHKSQGKTLRYAQVYLERAFTEGQVYTALSRATSLDGLSIVNFDPEKIVAHPLALQFYNELEKRQIEEDGEKEKGVSVQ